MSLLNLIAISGIFGKKDEDFDILPPPPPFPHIGEKEKELMEKEKSGKEEQKKREQQEKLRLKEEKRKQEELERKRLEKIRSQEAIKKKNRKLMERRAKTAKKKTFHFLNKVGMAKTMKEKAEHHRQRKEYTELRKNAEKILAEEARHRELESKKQIKLKEKETKKKKDFEIREKAGITGFEEKPALKEKKPIFGKIFMRKDEELEKELEELDKNSIEPLGRTEEPKIEELGEIEEETEKPHDAAMAEEEIQKAIDGIKKKEKKPSILGRLFGKKEVKEQAMETPEVMPRFEERTDEVELVEEKIHKARMALMDFKFDIAKKTYIEIMRSYNDMDSKKRARVYRDIKDLYYERKAAEKYAK